ncbi:MAG: DEAD/DEAH box helicase [Bryobacterales bacterium]|nr:DEAD/DEAH box helicase [Bryobacterales bacterium]
MRDETQVLYISPLKALSNDVKQNLSVPLSGVQKSLWKMGLLAPEIRTWVRTGDTPQSERAKMLRRPPHIIVTTPESLYILLTAGKSREVLRNVRTVIVDEIHAVARDKRGSHLSLSLERLDALTFAKSGRRPVRIGLSATQSPIEEVARFLVGTDRIDPHGKPRCTIIDTGHARKMDLRVEIPNQPLSAVASNEMWEEIYDRIAQMIQAERTTLVFVNTRRLAERIGEDQVTSHHGSLSRTQRLKAEQRLKSGQLKALVATASLELGIDIGTVDLAIQIGSPHAISTLLQRIGRSGHTLGATPRGCVFALSRDELVECAALLRAVRRGRLDKLVIPAQPVDILAQQIVASVASTGPEGEWDEDELYAMCRRAYPYRELTRARFDETVRMLAEGFSTRRGRSGAHLHYDAIGKRIRARRGARLAAITSGGAIPDNADYQVVQEPESLFVGTVNEDFAIESVPGDIFLLGNTAWRILRVEQSTLRVADAHGEPPTIPFWLGEAPARTTELSKEVSDLREEVGKRLDPPTEAAERPHRNAVKWLEQECGLTPVQAAEIVEYLAASRAALGVIPTQKTLVLERFFDASGGMQLVVHSPYGGRINRAWGLALRKRFCRSFNFELQAAANEDAIVLSLGLSHSFPLDEVFHYLHPNTAEDLLVQALLAAPMFPTRWRWNASRALAILRHSGGRRVPPALLRMKSDDLLASVFPDSAACAENLTGPIEVPDHPLVQQTIHDCLTEAMDITGFLALLRCIEQGTLQLVARDTTEPSPLAHEILNARPYAFLDDAPLEERRTRAVQTRRNLDFKSTDELGRLDSEAIELVRQQAAPQVENADELHDALMLAGFVIESQHPGWSMYFEALAATRRAAYWKREGSPALWIAAERRPLFDAIAPQASVVPNVAAPAHELQRRWTREEALAEIVRGRMEMLGPTTARDLALSVGVATSEIETALATLEKQGGIFRGHFSGSPQLEWCDRRLLARIHRATLDRLRREIEPVTAADFLRFLAGWQHASGEQRVDGPLGLSALVGQLQGYEIPAAAWESSVLSLRMTRYDPAWLDQLCLAGEVAWLRLIVPGPPAESDRQQAGANRASPITLLYRQQMREWMAAMRTPASELTVPRPSGSGGSAFSGKPTTAPLRSRLCHEALGTRAAMTIEYLERHGASFFQDIVNGTGLLRTEVESGLRELIAAGLVISDGFAGLRALAIAPDKTLGTGAAKHKDGRPGSLPTIPHTAGRWSALRRESANASGQELQLGREPARVPAQDPAQDPAHDPAEMWARQLLWRYGVVFHRILERESGLPPWRDLLRSFRRLEARGEIRGGRFVAGFSGEQYALPEAVAQLRAVRRAPAMDEIVVICGADPLNLAGILTPGRKVAALATHRILLRDGLPLAALESGEVVELHPAARELGAQARQRLEGPPGVASAATANR